MKIYDIIVAVPGKEGKTFWRTIGSVFTKDGTVLESDNNKPAGFSIDYPAARGIIAPRETKEEREPGDGD